MLRSSESIDGNATNVAVDESVGIRVAEHTCPMQCSIRVIMIEICRRCEYKCRSGQLRRGRITTKGEGRRRRKKIRWMGVLAIDIRNLLVHAGAWNGG